MAKEIFPIKDLFGDNSYHVPSYDVLFGDKRTPMQKQIEALVGNGIPVKDKFGQVDFLDSPVKLFVPYTHSDSNEFELQAHLARMNAATSENLLLAFEAAKIEEYARGVGRYLATADMTPEQVTALVQMPRVRFDFKGDGSGTKTMKTISGDQDPTRFSKNPDFSKSYSLENPLNLDITKMFKEYSPGPSKPSKKHPL